MNCSQKLEDIVESDINLCVEMRIQSSMLSVMINCRHLILGRLGK